jgi:hypothetical protein
MQSPSHANDDATALLAQGVSALKGGDMARAKDLIAQSIRLNPRNEYAWLWLSGVVATDDERRRCLERVLELNPQNDAARHGLAVLARPATARAAPPRPPAPAPSTRPSVAERASTLPPVAPPAPPPAEPPPPADAGPAAVTPAPAESFAPRDTDLAAVSPAPPMTPPDLPHQPVRADDVQAEPMRGSRIRPLTPVPGAAEVRPDTPPQDPLASLRPVAQERKIDWLKIALIVLVCVVILVAVVIGAQVFLTPVGAT